MSVLTLNVSGIYYYTTADTLLNSGSQYFEKMSKINSETEIFIDRDGGVFNIILNYMRQKKLILDTPTNPLLLFLLEESRFYKLNGLTQEIEKLLN